jgi:hypothetical protein
MCRAAPRKKTPSQNRPETGDVCTILEPHLQTLTQKPQSSKINIDVSWIAVRAQQSYSRPGALMPIIPLMAERAFAPLRGAGSCSATTYTLAAACPDSGRARLLSGAKFTIFVTMPHGRRHDKPAGTARFTVAAVRRAGYGSRWFSIARQY